MAADYRLLCRGKPGRPWPNNKYTYQFAQLTARSHRDIYHAADVRRELRSQMFRSGSESTGFAGLKWMYDGINPQHVFN
jgi:hypothetical protein